MERLSDAAVELGRKDDYVELRYMALGVRREALKEHSDYYAEFHLGVELVSLSWPLSQLGRFEEAIKVGQEGLEYLQKSRTMRFAVSGEKLSSMLYTYSLVLSRASSIVKAYEVSAESVKIRREIKTVRRDYDASAFYQYAVTSAAVKRWDESIEAAKESIKHFRFLSEDAPHTYNSSVLTGMRLLAMNFAGSGQFDKAMEVAQDMVEAAEKWFPTNPELYRSDLAFAFYHYAICAADLQLWDKAITADERSIEILKDTEATSASSVIRGLQAYSYHLSCAGKSDESSGMILEALNHYRSSNIPVKQTTLMEQAGFQLSRWQRRILERAHNENTPAANNPKASSAESSSVRITKVSCDTPISVPSQGYERKRWFSTSPIEADQLQRLISMQLNTLSHDQGYGGSDVGHLSSVKRIINHNFPPGGKLVMVRSCDNSARFTYRHTMEAALSGNKTSTRRVKRSHMDQPSQYHSVKIVYPSPRTKDLA